MSVKNSVLQALQNKPATFLSGEALSESLGVSRAAVWKAIKALREDGYSILGATNKGYMIADKADSITEDAVRIALPKALRDLPLYVYDVTDSTNAQAKNLSAVNTEFLRGVVLANQQTDGRGRLGRSFFSPQNGIYMSVVIKPDFDMRSSVLVTVAAAAAVVKAIENVCGETAQIKWVNDIYIKNKKICGILTEAVSDFESGQIERLIVGIGINTSIDGFPAELGETAGALEGKYSKPALAAEIISYVAEYLGELKGLANTSSAPSFLKIYRNAGMLTGREIKIYQGAYRSNPEEELGGIPATALGIDDWGGLIVKYENGESEVLRTGEVSVRLEGDN